MNTIISKLFDRNNKLKYYVKGLLNFYFPTIFSENRLNVILNSLYSGKYNEQYILDRVNYYNKLEIHFSLSPKQHINTNDALNGISSIKQLNKHKINTYVLDSYYYLKYFPKNFQAAYWFGDVSTVPSQPTILKSRPVTNNNNSVLLKLNKVRHFYFIKDKQPYSSKQNKLVWCGNAKANLYKNNIRQKVIAQFHNHPLCYMKRTNPILNGETWEQGYMSKYEQLSYKFILSIEGNDVATNLKWIMSSNSLCFMTKPKYETWFMEGRLIPNFHYALIKDDYSDLVEKIKYYTKNTSEALEIIKNANAYIKPFLDVDQEKLISLLVLYKYFLLSGQIKDTSYLNNAVLQAFTPD